MGWIMQSENYQSYIRSRDWYSKSANFQSRTGNRCALFPWLTATDAHHLTYKNLGNEMYVRDCVPLSRYAHNLIHNSMLSVLLWQGKGKKGTAPLRTPFNYILRACTIVISLYAIVAGKKKAGKPIKRAKL